jgi:hypothetical protein
VRTKKVKLSPESVARLEEIRAELQRTHPKWPQMTLEQVTDWALLRQYNRGRAVRRHALSLKGISFEVSPLEERDRSRRIHDDE